MSRHRLCYALWGISLFFFVGSGVLLSQFFLARKELALEHPQPVRETKSQVESSEISQHTKLELNDPVWQMQLQRPLFEVQSSPAATKPIQKTFAIAQPSKPEFQLLGTVIEKSENSAIFSLPNGIIQIRKEGETVGLAPKIGEVREIGDGVTKVEYFQSIVDLRTRESK